MLPKYLIQMSEKHSGFSVRPTARRAADKNSQASHALAVHRKNKSGGENSTVHFRIFEDATAHGLAVLVRRSTSLKTGATERSRQNPDVPQILAVCPSQQSAGRRGLLEGTCATYAAA
jgi:hypothetical protein